MTARSYAILETSKKRLGDRPVKLGRILRLAPHRVSQRLACQRPCHRVGVLFNHRQQYLRSLVGTVSSLLPVSYSPKRQVEPRREFFLGQIELLAQRANSR